MLSVFWQFPNKLLNAGSPPDFASLGTSLQGGRYLRCTQQLTPE